MRASAATAMLEQLAEQQRRILSRWRALLLLRRATFALPPERRRWERLPRDGSDVQPVLRQMVRRGDLDVIADASDLYQVSVPYARTRFITEDEVLGEIHPFSAISHFSALVFHQLTDQLPKHLTVSIAADGRGGLLPLGTDASDWDGLPLVRGKRASRILDQPVQWFRLRPARFFGMQEYRPRGYPVRVMTPGRTLLDGLLAPESCGGLENVLRAWVRAGETLDLDELVADVERFDVQVLRQRVGYVLDQLALRHPATERWQRHIQRGGSIKLLAAAPFASTFDERWSLSLNGPVEVLQQGAP